MISIKIVTHIFAAETFTCISVAETSNCIIATETVTFISATKRSTNISVAESTTHIITIESQNLNNCNRRWHLHNCCRKRQLHSSDRNCHLQNWLQKLLLAEMVTVRYRFSYNKEIEWISKTYFKGCIRYICASLFLSLNESTFQTRKNVFISLQKHIHSQENQVLEFYIFKFHDVIKCLSLKQIHFTE